jgi:hypothetical protein
VTHVGGKNPDKATVLIHRESNRDTGPRALNESIEAQSVGEEKKKRWSGQAE